MHDRKLPVTSDDYETVEEFIRVVESDVRFLESLRIMDYSLFLIVLEVPKGYDNPSTANSEDLKLACNEIDLTADLKNTGNSNNFDSSIKPHPFTTLLTFEDQDRKTKEEDLFARLDELIKLGRFVMFSPSKRFVYIMGLIDYLGKWNLNKRLEMYSKTFLAHFIRQNTDFSVKPPHEFARRFLKKVKRIFRVQKNYEKMLLRQTAVGDMYPLRASSASNLLYERRTFSPKNYAAASQESFNYQQQ